MNFLMWFGNTTIILMAGIMGIDTSLFEAAEVDGASSWQRFYRITLPLLKPILIYVIITSMIGGIQMFLRFLLMVPAHLLNQQRRLLCILISTCTVRIMDLAEHFLYSCLL